MHDIDRTFMEYNPETEAYETGEPHSPKRNGQAKAVRFSASGSLWNWLPSYWKSPTRRS